MFFAVLSIFDNAFSLMPLHLVIFNLSSPKYYIVSNETLLVFSRTLKINFFVSAEMVKEKDKRRLRHETLGSKRFKIASLC